MGALFRYEIKVQVKALIIWALAVGGMGLACILMFKSIESNMEGMAENFASMGGFADAFGMNELSIATIKGFFATEIGTIHALGGSLFAASIATVILSKEEDGHTAEFTYTLPVSRNKVIVLKFTSVIFQIVAFTVICALLYCAGFVILGEESEFGSEFVKYMAMQFVMNVEVASICFLLSSVSKKNKLGIGISVALVMYIFDLMARAIPDLKNAIIVTPFSYSNATLIFTNGDINSAAYFIGIFVMIICTGLATAIYSKRDLAS